MALYHSDTGRKALLHSIPPISLSLKCSRQWTWPWLDVEFQGTTKFLSCEKKYGVSVMGEPSLLLAYTFRVIPKMLLEKRRSRCAPHLLLSKTNHVLATEKEPDVAGLCHRVGLKSERGKNNTMIALIIGSNFIEERG